MCSPDQKGINAGTGIMIIIHHHFCAGRTPWVVPCGCAAGMVTGSVGAVTKPLTSVLEFTAVTAESIRNSARPPSLMARQRRCRLPRAVHPGSPLCAYSMQAAVQREVSRNLEGTPNSQVRVASHRQS